MKRDVEDLMPSGEDLLKHVHAAAKASAWVDISRSPLGFIIPGKPCDVTLHKDGDMDAMILEEFFRGFGMAAGAEIAKNN